MADPGRDNSASFDYDYVVIVMSANPGVNPSLTITAISERAMSRVPQRDAQRAWGGNERAVATSAGA